MKKLILSIVMISATSFISYSQEFTITQEPIYNYTIDRFTNEIYYEQYYINQRDVQKTNFDGSDNIKTNFQSTPFFANNSHKAIILEWTGNDEISYYLFNFETNERTYLFQTNSRLYFPDISFSCNDSLIYIKSNPITYYSFKDSLLYVKDTLFQYDSKPIWYRDNNKIIYNKNGAVFTYSISANTFDTLISTKGYDEITSFSYSSKTNLLAYGYQGDGYPDSSLIYTLNLTNSAIKRIFTASSDSNYSGHITKMKWDKEGNQLAFTSRPFLTPHVENFYVYKMNMDTTYQYAEINDGFTYQLEWLDSIRISYKNASNGYKLMGLTLDTPLLVKKVETNTYAINITSYPNPFNSESIIEFSLPDRSEVNITVYNILGQKIKVLVNQNKEKGSHQIKWKGKDNNNNTIPTGIYIVNFIAKTKNNVTYKKSLKTLNLK